MNPLSAEIHFTTSLIDAAYLWIIKNRRHYPPDADIWHLRFHWGRERSRILSRLNAGKYRLQPLHIIRKASGEYIALWSSSDALVLKMLTDTLQPHLPVHSRCEHVQGHGGGKDSTRRVHDHLLQHGTPFVFRTDIKGYYASINKRRLYNQLTRYVQHPILLNLLWQFLHYSVEDGGNFHTPSRGISRGSSLSPLLAAFHLYDLDSHFAKNTRVRYARYMDDFIILAPTRWTLRRAVRDLKRALNDNGFSLHPDKTQLGKTERGFDWMGLWFTKRGIHSIAPRAFSKHLLHCRRLYEQIRHLKAHHQDERMALYRRRFYAALTPAGFRGEPYRSTSLNGANAQNTQPAASTDTL
ncbi:reverse transcriptase domain-containing protein [Serratia ureilytica]|uniref:reverse transcriptase domain-containing protein n=1 Tax=Serratia ureilytica TaxID=300181 RepID=UPI00313A7E5A